jgi:PAS domain S-box-containing protein
MDKDRDNKDRENRGVCREYMQTHCYWALPIVFWAILSLASLKWHLYLLDKEAFNVALESGRSMFRMIDTTRLWNASHGGVYVPISDLSPPNPYLDIPDRDVTTVDGKRLTMINPAYMTRQISEIAREVNSVEFHITSLKPIRPGNMPTPWEEAALKQFDNGSVEEARSLIPDGTFIYMAPLKVTKGCLRCHEKQGYKDGDTRGGISITVPVSSIAKYTNSQRNNFIVLHVFIFISMVLTMLFFMGRLRRQWLALKDAKDMQEAVVETRTAELKETNTRLTDEIAERRAAEEIVRESETKFRSLIQSVMDGIISTDAEGAIVAFNRGAETLFGYLADEVIAKPVSMLIPERLTEAYLRAFKTFQLLGESYMAGKRVEFEGLKKDGTEFSLDISLASWKTTSGTFYTGIVRDITTRKKMEDQINASLKEKVVLIREIHHRVKNNMQIITSLINIQSGLIKNPEDAEVFNETKNRIMAMSLVHERLYQSDTLAEIDFADYAKNLARGLFRSYGVDPARIALKIDIPSLTIGVDTAISCGLVLNELISNSLKYAFKGGGSGEIGITVSSHDDEYDIEIWDDGAGFPDAVGLRGNETLGLQLVVSIVENQLRGSVTLDKDKGARFKINFREIKQKQRLSDVSFGDSEV